MKVGDKVVNARRDTAWSQCGATIDGPKLNEVVTISKVEKWAGFVLLQLEEYPGTDHFDQPLEYYSGYFEPLVSDEVLEKALKEIEQPVEV